ncbi:MAG TPA: glycosyltransferase [Actinophytocola sp.]|nr:glycosyltransferase [Actinophytocola sp.]
MRVLFSSLSAYGHFFQLLPLAVAARERGDEVLFATGEVRHPLLSGLGLTPVLAGRSTDEVVGDAVGAVRAEHPDFDQLPQERQLELISTRFSRLMPQAFVDALRPVFAENRPDLVIHGGYCPGPGIAAAVDGIPALCHGTGRARADDNEMMARTAVVLREYAAELGVTLPEEYAVHLGNTFLDICPPSMQDPHFLATADRVELRPVPFNPPAELPGWVRTRDRGRPLVYLTMGTESDSVEMLRHAVDGLSTLDVDVLVATGRLPVEALGEVPGNVVVEAWVPQADLLPHADLVVHHGGNGTTFSAMSAGRPQLFLQNKPGPDQLLNADMVVAAGAAERLLLEEVDAESVAARARTLLGDDARRDAATAVAEEIAGMPSPDTIAARLKSYT